MSRPVPYLQKKLDFLPGYMFNAVSLELKLQNDALRNCHLGSGYSNEPSGSRPSIFLG